MSKKYAKVEGSVVITYPYGQENLYEENPYTNYGIITESNFIQLYSTTDDSINNNYTLVEVVEGAAPDFNPQTQKVQLSNQVTYNNGTWSIVWETIELTQEERLLASSEQAVKVRTRIQNNLRASDFSQVSDIQLPLPISSSGSQTTKEQWAAWRQQLRDLPSTPAFPWDPELIPPSPAEL